MAAVQPRLTRALRAFCRQAAAGAGVTYDPFESTAQAWIDGRSFQLVQELFDRSFETTRKALRKTLAAGWQAGEGADDLAGRIRGVFSHATRYRSYMIARTETTACANAAMLGVWEQAKMPYKQWLSARDERVCPVCGPLDREVVALHEAFSGGMLAPPAHPNCLPGTEQVLTSKGCMPIAQVAIGDLVLSHAGQWRQVEQVMSHWYDGPLVHVRAGATLRLTPNHLVLTARGWVEAGRLQEGQDLVKSFRGLVEDGALVPVTGLKSVPYAGPVYNLQVAGDESYVAQGIAVHNCRCTMLSVRHPSGVPEFDTPEEAQAWAAKRFPHIDWDFAGADAQALTPTLRQFTTLSREYPEVTQGLRYVGTYGGNADRFRAQAFAHARTGEGIIGLNPQWYGDAERLLRELQLGVDSRFHPTGTSGIESIMTHELGHFVEAWCRGTQRALLPVVSTQTGIGSIAGTFDSWLAKHWDPRAADKVSRYATVSPTEGFAEAFTALYHSPKPLPAFAKRTREALDVLFAREEWIEPGQWQWTHEVPAAAAGAAREAIKRLKQKLGL